MRLEKEILGVTHAEIAGKMALHWNIPDNLVEAIAHHHDEKWQLNPKLGRIVSYANRFVLGMIDFVSMLELFRQSGDAYPASWKPEDLKRIEEMLQEEIKKACKMLN